MGLEESIIAVNIGTLLNIFVEPRGLGLVAGEGGTIQLDINLVRIPDVSFISWERLPGGEVPRRADSPRSFPTWPWRSSAGATPARRWTRSSRSISRRASAWSGIVRPREPGRRRLHGAGPLHPADGLDAARRRRRPARFLGPGRRAVPDAEAAGRQGRAEEERAAAREEERAAARSLKVGSHSTASLPGVCTDHAHDADPVSPGDLRARSRSPQELRDLVCRVTGMHPTDAVQWLARAPGTWPQPLEEPEVRKLLDGLYEAGDRGRGLADRPVSGAEPARGRSIAPPA